MSQPSGRYEAISDARLREDVLRARRVRLELSAQLLDERAQILCLLTVFGAPDCLQELPVGQNLVRVGRQGLNQVVFSAGEVDFFRALPDHVGGKVDLDIAGANDRRIRVVGY